MSGEKDLEEKRDSERRGEQGVSQEWAATAGRQRGGEEAGAENGLKGGASSRKVGSNHLPGGDGLEA